ncbi:dirigent protein 23-like [Syzygium oleosum]|uniref:dirigent protein 23-like n=1 Tax=Syzygium oleosum TaxID=219896 RepID=UPI0024B8F332|nr:dirigent protein 23-like [Syzygium oleosum]
MAKLSSTAMMVVALALVATAANLAHAEADNLEKVDEWFNRLSNAKRKTTCLHFYFHDTLSGKNPTAVGVTEATMTRKSPTSFGAINMIDNPLTEGPKPESPLMGRAKGFYGFAGLELLGLLMNVNLVVTSPKYNSSTLSIMGHNSALEIYREMPIIGGTGFFRLASGIATGKT